MTTIASVLPSSAHGDSNAVVDGETKPTTLISDAGLAESDATGDRDSTSEESSSSTMVRSHNLNTTPHNPEFF